MTVVKAMAGALIAGVCAACFGVVGLVIGLLVAYVLYERMAD